MKIIFLRLNFIYRVVSVYMTKNEIIEKIFCIDIIFYPKFGCDFAAMCHTVSSYPRLTYFFPTRITTRSGSTCALRRFDPIALLRDTPPQ